MQNGWNLKKNLSWDYSGVTGGLWKPLDPSLAKFLNLNFAHDKETKIEWLEEKCWWFCLCKHMVSYCDQKQFREQYKSQCPQQNGGQRDGGTLKAKGKKRRKKAKRVSI